MLAPAGWVQDLLGVSGVHRCRPRNWLESAGAHGKSANKETRCILAGRGRARPMMFTEPSSQAWVEGVDFASLLQ